MDSDVLEPLSRAPSSQSCGESETRRYRHLLLFRLPLPADTPTAVVDADGRILFASQQLSDLVGVSRDALVGVEIWPFIHSEDRARAGTSFQPANLGLGAAAPVALRLLDASDTGASDQIQSATSGGQPAEVDESGVGVPAHPAQVRSRQLGDEPSRDHLTGLLDRDAVIARVGALLRDPIPGVTVGVLIADLDHFSLINSSYGRRVGDLFLRVVARRLEEGRRSGIVGRTSGDEFVLVGTGPNPEAVCQRLNADLSLALARPVSAAGRHSQLTASVGVAHSVGSSARAAQLLRNAELAMRRAKDLGSDRSESYSSHLLATARSRLELEGGLRGAVENGELRVHYQPVISFDGGVGAVEALVRWQDPQHGLLSPSDFIPLAEETGLILPIGEWVLQEACRQVAIWRADLAPGLGLAVNLSALQLGRPGLAARVVELAQGSGMDPASLCLEVTETALMEDSAVAWAALEELAELGVRIALDDFGVGYSSLLYLRRFPVHIVKLDRSFVAGLGRYPADDAIVGSVVDLAHVLGMQAVAEGVETSAQVELLRRLGCDAAQGYYWSRPLPADRLATLLAAPGGPLRPRAASGKVEIA